MLVVTCPVCSSAEVGHYGKNPSGTQRLRCRTCRKIWTLQPKSRSLTPEKEAAIVRALAERTSQRGIARTFGVSRDTVRALRKKTLTASSE